MLYRSPLRSGRLGYWYFDLYDDFPETLGRLHEGIPVTAFHRGLRFEGNSADAIFTHFSSNGQCVWYLDKWDIYNPQVPEEMRNLLAASSLKAINPSIDDQYLPPEETFGREPLHGWCYYYQKIDLAQERQQWAAILELWGAAQREDQLPNNQIETLPVIIAFAETGDFGSALDLSLDTFRRQPDSQPMLCAVWAEKNAVPQSVSEKAADLFERLACE
jgi:hypothetical protein